MWLRLVAAFFTALHRVLREGGRLTILSDNERYCRTLAKSIGSLKGPAEPYLFSSVELEGAPGSYEQMGRARLYHGVPGPESGHLVHATSFFDRFWMHGHHEERYFMLFERAPLS